MRRVRGLVILGIAVVLGLIVAKGVHDLLKGPKRQKERRPATTAKLAPRPESATFTESIPVGMRAVSIKVDEVTGVSRKIAKGDWVDVLATNKLASSPAAAAVTRLVLERVQVLDVPPEEGARGRSRGRVKRDWTVTLLVTPEQGASLVAAASQAKISLLARRSRDADPQRFQDIAFTHKEGSTPLIKPEGNAAAWIRPGMRAITITVRDTDGICGTLRRGDRVDVLITCPFSRFASGGNLVSGAKGVVTEYEMATRTLLQGAEVLTSEKGLEVGTGENEPVRRVTLQVTPQDAEKVACAVDATNKAIIRLVSRNWHDRKLVRTHGQALSALLSRKKEFNRIDVYKGTKAQVKPFFR